MIDVILQGINGQMGQAVCEQVLNRTDCRIVAGIDPRCEPCGVPLFAHLSENTVPADVLIDFSSPDALDETVRYCASHRLPCVICTTGLDARQQQMLCTLARTTAVLKSANMSAGINVMIELVKKAAAALGTGFDIEIIEKHHHHKKDAPSGTALMLADALCAASSIPYHPVCKRSAASAARSLDEIGIHAVRAGSIVGEHEVIFAGEDEILTISHSAASRNIFAGGAVNAAVFLAGKPAGMYTMKDVIGL